MKKSSIMLFTLSMASTSWAAEKANNEQAVYELDKVQVTGTQQEIQTTPGSAHVLDQAQLEKFEYTDIHRVLSAVPGVYIRTEDGYGLRPNIGMRGAPAERSQKISSMEDGILITPAPYSAPSAYYFPNVARMQSIETFKGPTSIQYGPNTVGGALNLVTTAIPETFSSKLNVSGGTDNFRKIQAHAGNTQQGLSWLAEGLIFGSDGFKTLDTSDDTGFQRNDINFKFGYTSPSNSRRYQRLILKIGYADETSDETYLGLTDDDFQDTPYRRYTASQLDKSTWDHQQVHATHLFEFSDSLELTTRVYRNTFDRSWNKFEDFRRNTEAPDDPFLNATYSISDVLANPNGLGEKKYYDLLTGASDSNGTELQKLDITNNDRQYASQGIEFTLASYQEWGDWYHEIESGLRYHNDYVERNHTVKSYDISDGVLIHDDIERTPRLVNKGESDALAVYLKDKFSYEDWTFTTGLRAERITTQLTDRLNPSNNNRQTSTVWIPGAGLFYQYTEALGLLAGINKGFAPNAPSKNDNTRPEETVNAEFGLRYRKAAFHLETIGFFNRYDNLIGRCRANDTDCQVGDEFNGGRVDIAGAEISGGYQQNLGHWQLPINFTYTYTESAFQSAFESGFSQWGNVVKGDELPYLPAHQLRIETGLSYAKWDFSLSAKFTDAMRESAGQGNIKNATHTKAYSIIDAAMAYDVSKTFQLQLTVDNLFDEVTIVSRRPFGARPNKPRTLIASLKYAL